MKKQKKVVLISGADRGMRYATVQYLIKKGYGVYAMDQEDSDGNDLNAISRLICGFIEAIAVPTCQAPSDTGQVYFRCTHIFTRIVL